MEEESIQKAAEDTKSYLETTGEEFNA